ncbi:MAG: hypothetical protein DA328_06610 [Nitrososphaeraceae archaeon]|nr:hypothetical protein [Nitrososphaeraceae archaeon]
MDTKSLKNKKMFLQNMSLIVTLAATLSLMQIGSNMNIALGQTDVKTTVQEISTHINEALKSYATSIGEQYFEGEHSPVNVNTTAIENAPGVGEGKLVNTSEYGNAQNHLKTAQFMFLNLIPQIQNTNSDDVIQIQSGLLMLQNIFNYRSSYSLAEDVGFGVVLSHLDNIAK